MDLALAALAREADNLTNIHNTLSDRLAEIAAQKNATLAAIQSVAGSGVSGKFIDTETGEITATQTANADGVIRRSFKMPA